MINRFLSFLKVIGNLSKAGISISVALTTVTGYLLSTRQLDMSIIYPFMGVLFLAMSASTLNQLQERHTDKLMPRTQRRPLTNGSITVSTAIIVTLLAGLSGFLILYYYNGALPAILGLMNLIWYNGVYTPLKYKTAFAAVPGGLVGAIPPVIGWVSGGGDIMHPSSIAMAGFFFIGQIPHFWLIILKYSNEYRLAGIKLITDKFTIPQLRRLVFTWMLATAFSGSIMTFIINIENNAIFLLMHLLSILLLVYSGIWLTKNNGNHSTRAFIIINLYYLLVMLCVFFDVILSN